MEPGDLRSARDAVEPYRTNFKTHRAEYEARAVKLLQSVGLAGWVRGLPRGGR